MTEEQTERPADGPRRRDAAATRESLLSAARQLIARDGAGAVSTRDVAAAAGANQALVYRYFGSKEALLIEALAQTEPDRTIADTPLADLPHTLLRRALDPDTPAEVRASSMATLVAGAGTDVVRTIARDRIHAGYTTQLAERLGGEDAALRAELVAALITGINALRTQIGTTAIAAADIDVLATYVDRMAAALLNPPGPTD
ncbi:TetR/AcrR family transcriptional regulator [Trujillonella endophytica]|uniref:Transcriptional regulator, TetR family n=1 Tax=Trujillonella endophytica TaxID=673521 RepID=A0A1H8PFL1_9ACTN|nr:TetR/AcrR family transcriptional regulator [Trujillella endophytica]SEO40537.1 transcriptional regulator, TetR family [Trujillella endophytica]